jgi:hypothetical protein
MPRRRRISPSARAPSWPLKAPSRWPITCIPSRRWKAAFERTGRAAARGAAPAVGGAQQPEWFEEVERYLDLDPVQFNYSLLTRSQRISHENLRLRDRNGWRRRALVPDPGRAQPAGAGARADVRALPLRDMELKNRIVVSPMAQYKAVDGCPTDWHLVHYGERAKGGAGLVYTEMTCVSPEGRITPGCPGLYAPEHEAPGSGSSISSMPRRGQDLHARSAIPAARARPSSAGRSWMRRSRKGTGR